jgi:ABC-2 type transport system permease protein
LHAAVTASDFRFPRAAVVAAIARRDYRITRSYRLAFGLDVVYGALELVLYFFVSKVVGHVPSSSLAGAPSYFAFAAVGVVLGAVLLEAVHAFSAGLRGEQLTGTLEVLAAQPLTLLELCTGLLSFPLSFASVRAAAYLVIASFWMDLDLSRTSWPGVAGILAAAAFAMAPLGILAGAAVLMWKRGTAIVGTLVYLMSLLGGVVFPISVLPGSLHWLGRLMPVRFAYDGVRSAMFTGGGWESDLLALVGFGAALTPLALAAFAAAFAHARRAGTISEY